LEDLLASYRELPGTEREAKAVAKLARENGCQPVKLWQGEDATEKILRESSSPYLLHMATHGVFLPDPVITNAQAIVVRRQVVPRQPMHRSWIMLARANETLDAWRHGDVPDPLNDGLLTAEEASLLPLGNTWLVTLSACDTGLGVGRSGEGVMGLRRGLALAGARHILMTLWPIHDDYTCSFMEAFYAAAIPTNDAVGALGSVQQHLLREWRKNKSPAQAARFFGGFVISSRGR
jgi:CHAT domain-containing protein